MIALLRILVVALALGLSPGATHAQEGALAAAKAQGLVGERPDGLVGIVSRSASAQIRALVDQTNAQRRAVYQQIAQRERTTVEVVQQRFGERLVRETPRGQFYMDANQRWVRR
jgi:hypothetical protein